MCVKVSMKRASDASAPAQDMVKKTKVEQVQDDIYDTDDETERQEYMKTMEHADRHYMDIQKMKMNDLTALGNTALAMDTLEYQLPVEEDITKALSALRSLLDTSKPLMREGLRLSLEQCVSSLDSLAHDVKVVREQLKVFEKQHEEIEDGYNARDNLKTFI